MPKCEICPYRLRPLSGEALRRLAEAEQLIRFTGCAPKEYGSPKVLYECSAFKESSFISIFEDLVLDMFVLTTEY